MKSFRGFPSRKKSLFFLKQLRVNCLFGMKENKSRNKETNNNGKFTDLQSLGPFGGEGGLGPVTSSQSAFSRK
jgi:hypothetical protein